MLTPDEIERLGNSAEKLLAPVTDYLIREIAERISEAGELTATASYQIWRTQQLGLSQKEIKERLKKLLKVTDSKLEELLTQSAEVGYNFDIKNLPTANAISFKDNKVIQDIVKASVELMHEEFSGIVQTRAIGFYNASGVWHPLNEAIVDACDFAFKKVATGAADYNKAVREATRELANRGICAFDYESGVHTELGAAVRRNVLGGLGLMQEKISQQTHDDLGANGWEISAHYASAPDHEPIQGQQYTDEEYESLNNALVRRVGTLNCGHSAHPIIIGVSQPQYNEKQLAEMREANEKGIEFDGKHYTTYEATQKQRAIERAIRRQKRRVEVAKATGDEEKHKAEKAKLKYLSSEYERFSAAADLRPQYERMWTTSL